MAALTLRILPLKSLLGKCSLTSFKLNTKVYLLMAFGLGLYIAFGLVGSFIGKQFSEQASSLGALLGTALSLGLTTLLLVRLQRQSGRASRAF